MAFLSKRDLFGFTFGIVFYLPMLWLLGWAYSALSRAAYASMPWVDLKLVALLAYALPEIPFVAFFLIARLRPGLPLGLKGLYAGFLFALGLGVSYIFLSSAALRAAGGA